MTALELEPALAEEAVFLAMNGRPAGDSLAGEWQRGRDSLYAAPAGAERDRAFQRQALAWFERLGLGRPITAALSACPRVAAKIPTLQVRRALRARDEGSDVLGNAERPARVLLALRVQRFLDAPGLEALALRELLHAEDMLDPAFGFRPALLGDDLEHPRRELLRDRFHMLWEARVQGRMARRADPGAEPPPPLERFRQAFAGRTEVEDVAQLFARAWSGALASYADLAGAAREPDGLTAPATPHQVTSR